jgi:hypothetical protein
MILELYTTLIGYVYLTSVSLEHGTIDDYAHMYFSVKSEQILRFQATRACEDDKAIWVTFDHLHNRVALLSSTVFPDSVQ